MDDFISTFTRKVETLLDAYNVEYIKHRSATTNTIYIKFVLGTHKLKIRIADHPPVKKADFYLHPRSKHSMQTIRRRVTRFLRRKKNRVRKN